jgi:hypothetical protein
VTPLYKEDPETIEDTSSGPFYLAHTHIKIQTLKALTNNQANNFLIIIIQTLYD